MSPTLTWEMAGTGQVVPGRQEVTKGTLAQDLPFGPRPPHRVKVASQAVGQHAPTPHSEGVHRASLTVLSLAAGAAPSLSGHSKGAVDRVGPFVDHSQQHPDGARWCAPLALTVLQAVEREPKAFRKFQPIECRTPERAASFVGRKRVDR